MRRPAALAAAILLAATIAPRSAFGGPAISVGSVDTSAYPRVTLHVKLAPSFAATATAPSFSVVENGRTARKVSSRPASQAPLAAVLVVDTSGSMSGPRLAEAKAAASALVSRLGPADKVAVVAVGSRPTVVSGFDADRRSTLAAIAALRASGDTALRDGLAVAAGLVARSGLPQRAVVLLSDGTDTASSSSLMSAISSLKAASAPVFVLTPPSAASAPAALTALVSSTGGRALPAGGKSEIAAAHAEMAGRTRDRYDVTYTSRRTTSKDLLIDVRVSVGTASAGRRVSVANPGYRPPPATGVLTGILTQNAVIAVAFVVCVFASVSLLGYLLFAAIARSSRPIKQLRYYDQSPEAAARLRAQTTRGRIMESMRRFAEKRGFAAELQRRLERAGLPLRPVEYISLHVALVTGAGLLALVLTRSFLVAALVVVLAVVAPPALLTVLAKRRRKQFESQLPDVFSLIAGSLRAGFGIMQAVDHIASEMPPPVSAEFARVESEARLGGPVEQALGKVADRMDSEDFRWAVAAIGIQREVGGNLAEVLDIVANTIRDRDSLRREIDGLTAESRLSARILTAMPFVVVVALLIMSPAYVVPMLTTPLGWGMLALAGVLLAFGYWWLKRVSRIEV